MKKALTLLTIVLLLIGVYCEQDNPVVSSIDNQITLESSLAKSNSNPNYGDIVFGPEVFTRLKGEPITDIREFNLEGFESTYMFVLHNGGTSVMSSLT